MVNGTTTRSAAADVTVLDRSLADKIDQIAEKYGKDESRLISILLDIQRIIPKQYIPTEVATYVSEIMALPLSRIYDVISFYHALSTTSRADFIIQICDSVVCKVVGNRTLIQVLEDALKIKVGEITKDEKFALEFTPCFGACDVAPAIRLNGEVHGHMDTEEKIVKLIESCKNGGGKQ